MKAALKLWVFFFFIIPPHQASLRVWEEQEREREGLHAPTCCDITLALFKSHGERHMRGCFNVFNNSHTHSSYITDEICFGC